MGKEGIQVPPGDVGVEGDADQAVEFPVTFEGLGPTTDYNHFESEPCELEPCELEPCDSLL